MVSMAASKRQKVTPADQLADAMSAVLACVGAVPILVLPAGGAPGSFAAHAQAERARRQAAMTAPSEAAVQAIRAWGAAGQGRAGWTR